MSDGVTYIPLNIENVNGNSNLSSDPSNLKTTGGKRSVKIDFDSVGSTIQALQGGSERNAITQDGTNNFGKSYFYNSGSTCKISSDTNIQLCDPTATAGSTAYEYIYINTISNGLTNGILGDLKNIVKIPGKIIDTMESSGTGSECQCMALNVTNPEGGSPLCAAAFINSASVNESDITSNICEHPYNTALYNSDKGSGSKSGSSSKLGSKSGSTSKKPGKISGFTTIRLHKIHKNIDRLFLLAMSILCLFILYNVLLKTI